MWLRTDIKAVADITNPMRTTKQKHNIFLEMYKHEGPINIQWFTN